MKQKETKQTRSTYLAPAIEIIAIENEGIMASSVNTGGNYGNGGSMFGNNARSKSRAGNLQSASPLSDLEDMINDILTVGGK